MQKYTKKSGHKRSVLFLFSKKRIFFYFRRVLGLFFSKMPTLSSMMCPNDYQGQVLSSPALRPDKDGSRFVLTIVEMKLCAGFVKRMWGLCKIKSHSLLIIYLCAHARVVEIYRIRASLCVSGRHCAPELAVYPVPMNSPT